MYDGVGAATMSGPWVRSVAPLAHGMPDINMLDIKVSSDDSADRPSGRRM